MFSKIKNYIAENTGILIRIDDIAENMNWNLMKKSEQLFDEYKIKPVLGVIPENKDKDIFVKDIPPNVKLDILYSDLIE